MEAMLFLLGKSIEMLWGRGAGLSRNFLIYLRSIFHDD
jgi:hypothetical protein